MKKITTRISALFPVFEKKTIRKLLSVVLTAALLLSALCIDAFAQEGKYKKALPLPELSGNYAADLIAVAKSQIGYKEASDHSTVYGAWNGDPYQGWGAEFISWCAEQANIPYLVIPKFKTITQFRDYFAKKTRCWYLKLGMDRKTFDILKGFPNKKIITPMRLREGDLIISGGANGEPGAISVFLSYGNKQIQAITGNVDDEVKLTTIATSNICGVIRPDYALKDTESIKNISSVDWWGSLKAVYTGNKTMPDITLYDTELKRKLVKDTDYTIKLRNAIEVGKAEIIFYGKGIYTGSYSFSYDIRPAKPELSYTKGSSKIKLTWKKITGATSYVLFKYDQSTKEYVYALSLSADRDYCVVKADLSLDHKFYLRVYRKGSDGRLYYTNSDPVKVKKVK